MNIMKKMSLFLIKLKTLSLNAEVFQPLASLLTSMEKSKTLMKALLSASPRSFPQINPCWANINHNKNSICKINREQQDQRNSRRHLNNWILWVLQELASPRWLVLMLKVTCQAISLVFQCLARVKQVNTKKVIKIEWRI